MARREERAPFSQQGRLQIGDVIYALNGTVIATPADLGQAADRLEPGTAAVLQVERNGELMFLGFRAERR
ncbi:MAG: PDZ domain-containing protein [Acidobacteria bacterium]|nr:PDZ domain-containing protein [Acidobacteriota bacterium]